MAQSHDDRQLAIKRSQAIALHRGGHDLATICNHTGADTSTVQGWLAGEPKPAKAATKKA
jgi:hypothetical protein